MSNAVQKRETRDFRVTAIQAAVLTIVVHLIFFLLFDYEKPQPREFESKPYKTMMLNLREPRRLSMRAVGEWLQYQNPAIMSRPEYRFGYSAAGALPRWRKQLALPRVTAPALNLKFAVPEFENLNANRFPATVPSLAELSGLNLAEPTSLHITQAAIAPFKYPLAMIAGVPLDTIDLSAVQLPENMKNIKTTRINISPGQFAMMPRIVLNASCGDVALDRAGIRAVFHYALKNPQELHNGREITILWHAGGVK